MKKMIYLAQAEHESGWTDAVSDPTFFLEDAENRARYKFDSLAVNERTNTTIRVIGYKIPMSYIKDPEDAVSAFNNWFDDQMEENCCLPNPDFEQEISTWYAVTSRDYEALDWGSYDYDKALKMAAEEIADGKKLVAVVEVTNGAGGGLAEREITGSELADELDDAGLMEGVEVFLTRVSDGFQDDAEAYDTHEDAVDAAEMIIAHLTRSELQKRTISVEKYMVLAPKGISAADAYWWTIAEADSFPTDADEYEEIDKIRHDYDDEDDDDPLLF